jgi:hypothetical protein
MSTQLVRWADAWILLSIMYATQRASPAVLTDIIAAADYINHAILTRGELETGFARLVDGGYVTHEAQGFSLTEAAKSFWSSTGSQERTASAAHQAVARFIGAPAWVPGEPLPEASTELYVSEAHYAAAVRQYLGTMGRAAKKIARHET